MRYLLVFLVVGCGILDEGETEPDIIAESGVITGTVRHADGTHDWTLVVALKNKGGRADDVSVTLDAYGTGYLGQSVEQIETIRGGERLDVETSFKSMRRVNIVLLNIS
jgi:hypothetical protein